jgi:hypothetical protein
MRRSHTLRILHVRQPVFTLGLLARVRFAVIGRPSLEEEASSDVTGNFGGAEARRSGNIWIFAEFMQRGIGDGRESG